MAVPKARRIAAEYIEDFICRLVRGGFVAKLLADSGQGDVRVVVPTI